MHQQKVDNSKSTLLLDSTETIQRDNNEDQVIPLNLENFAGFLSCIFNVDGLPKSEK